MKKLLQATLCLLLMVIICFRPMTAQATTDDETAVVSIPVRAEDGDCTAELLDKDGNVLQTLALKDGVETAFEIRCQGLREHCYSVRLSDEDSDVMCYDKTVYLIDVELFLTDDLEIFAVVTAHIEGDETGAKPEKLCFTNTPTAPDSPPIIGPQTGDDSRNGLWIALAVGSLVAVGGLGWWIVKDRRKEKEK